MSHSPRKSHGRLSISASAAPRELMTPTPHLKGAWKAKVLTLFPEAFPGVLGQSLTGKALQRGLWALEPIDLRIFGQGRHRKVDDTPAGGGAGLVMRADVLGRALAMAARGVPEDPARWPRVFLSPRGRPFTQKDAERFSKAEGMTLLCGRFEGVDQRVIDHFALEEISLGDFVMTGGEIAAQALIDATVRLIPDVLGNQASTEEESFSDGLLEHPQYTKPAEWMGHEIPPVLLSGDHAKIAAWRREEAETLTRARRPDLWAALADLPAEVAQVTDEASLAAYAGRGSDAHMAERGEALLAAVLDHAASGSPLILPPNPYTATALLLHIADADE